MAEPYPHPFKVGDLIEFSPSNALRFASYAAAGPFQVLETYFFVDNVPKVVIRGQGKTVPWRFRASNFRLVGGPW